MNSHTRGIVLHTVEYSETSLIIKIYTEQFGLVSYIINGVRSKKGKIKSNLFQPLSQVELTSSGKPGNNLQRITDICLSPPYTDIPVSITKSSITLFLSEIIYRSIREEEPNRRLFEFISSGLMILDVSSGNISRFHFYFMIQLSRYFGSFPHGTYAIGNFFDLREGIFTEQIPMHADIVEPQPAKSLWEFMNRTFENYSELKISDDLARDLLEALVQYYELHFTHGQQIRSHKVLKEILN